MNKIKPIILLILLLFNRSVFAQEIVSDVIITDNLKERNEVSFTEPLLTWDDFKGRAPRNSEWTAMTYSGIKLRYEYKVKNGEHIVKIILYPYMDQSQSWYTEAGHNDYTLAHEQLHFNITILLTHQLAEKLQNMKLSPKNFGKQINSIHDEYLEKLKQMQGRYDEETKHGINRMKQKDWNKKVDIELKKFE